jgi:hypothetical protein
VFDITKARKFAFEVLNHGTADEHCGGQDVVCGTHEFVLQFKMRSDQVYEWDSLPVYHVGLLLYKMLAIGYAVRLRR